MKKIFLLLFLCTIQVSSAQSVSKLNDDIASLYLKSFYKNQVTGQDVETIINELQEIVRSTNNKFILSADGAVNFIKDFELIKVSLQQDSIYKSLHTLYLKFISVLNDDYNSQLFLSPKKKIIFFTTSVSCECTLSMCYKQLAELIEFVNKNGNEYELIIEDTWIKSIYKDKYEAGLIPTILIFDKNNQEIKRLVRVNELTAETIIN